MDELKDRLKWARRRAEISQESLASRAGVTKANISKLEAGLTVNCALDTLFLMADVLQVDPRWLATGKSQSPPEDGPSLRIDANKALLSLPAELRDPILTMIESSARAAEQRYWQWVKEKES